MGANPILAVCDGGGNDTLAVLLVVGVVAGWAVVAAAVIRTGRNPRERRLLTLLLLAAIVIGSVVFLVPEAVSDDFVKRAIIALALTGATGVAAAWITGAVHVGRALFVSLWGSFFGPGGLLLLFVAALAVGTGCIS
jgi:hypothetical protein